MNHRDWQVAVCSYRRATTLRDKTMAYLQRCNMDLARVTVFVADAAERELYAAKLPQGVKLVVAQPGMRAVRNFTQQYYPEGQRVFNLDDDIEALYRKVDDKKTAPVYDLAREISTGFELCERWRLRLWGINAVLNPFFMKHTVTTDLKFLVGAVWGVVNSHDQALAVTIDEKEDFERTLKFYLADGGVVRLNYLAPKTRYYKEPGGMQGRDCADRVAASAASAKLLLHRYPGLCRINTARKKLTTEILLRDTRKTLKTSKP